MRKVERTWNKFLMMNLDDDDPIWIDLDSDDLLDSDEKTVFIFFFFD